MVDVSLVQKVEEKILADILNLEPDEKDESLTDILSEENKKEAAALLRKYIIPQNYELNNIYDKVADFLLADLVVREGKVVPKRIADPGDEDKKFLELYSALAQLDEELKDYKSFTRRNRKAESNIELKFEAAEERLKVVKRKLEEAKSKREGLNDDKKDQHEAKRLDEEIERYKKEKSEIKEQKQMHQNRMAFFDRELAGYMKDSPLRSYFDAALAKAKELGLEKHLNFEIPKTEKEEKVSLDADILSRKIEGIPIEFFPYTGPTAGKPVSFFGRWKYKIAAGIAAIVLAAGAIAYKFNAKRADKIISFNPETMELETIPPGRTVPLKREVDLMRVNMPNMKYIPGKIKVAFDSSKIKLILTHPGLDQKVEWTLKKFPRERLDSKDPDILLTSYRQEGDDLFNIYEELGLYCLLKRDMIGFFEEIYCPERKVPRSEIVEYVKSIARNYKTIPVSEAGIIIKEYKVVDAEYENNILTLITENNEFDLEIHVQDRVSLSGSDYDNIPDALIRSGEKDIYLDFSDKSKQVKVVVPGDKFNYMQHFFSPVSCTPKFD
ncbi:hypothetical protein KY343_05380 [Candidatus Woesearchaeota archaeon]|nr:hypothetical protein [Candidatus Woesearchaeota archaeon]